MMSIRNSGPEAHFPGLSAELSLRSTKPEVTRQPPGICPGNRLATAPAR